MYGSCVVVILQVLAVVSGLSPRSPCDNGWVLADNHTCLQFNNNYQLPQGQATLSCVNQGAALLRFANHDEARSFSAVAVQQAVDGWWTSLSDSCTASPNTLCTWTWAGTDQIVPGSLGWATEPTDTQHIENCVTMDVGGYLNDDMCSNRFGFICSFNLPNANDSCPGDDWTKISSTCYYVSHMEDPTEIMAWEAAKNACATFAQSPTVIPSLASFTNAQLKVLQSVVSGRSPGGKRWVGMNDQVREGTWAWADGSRITDTSFLPSKWHSYPDHSTGHSCGLVHSNGLMEQADCTMARPFVCKKYISPDMWLVPQDVGCPAPWLRGGRKCYYLNSNLTMDRTSARAFCSNMNGDLIKIQSQDENTWLSQQTVYYQLNNLWTGLQRTADGAQTWAWVDSSPANEQFYVWNKEPNDYGLGEDCAIVNTGGHFNDASCYMPAAYICELGTEDSPCPSGWVSNFDPDSDQVTCYYLSRVQDGKASWQQAKIRCQQLAGVPDAHLVAIESQKELSYLLSLLQKQPWTEYWTDLTDSGSEGSWQFSDSYMGTPPPIPWAQEPNNNGGHENCAVMLSEGRLADVNCDSQFYVACEKILPSVPLTQKDDVNPNTRRRHAHRSNRRDKEDEDDTMGRKLMRSNSPIRFRLAKRLENPPTTSSSGRSVNCSRSQHKRHNARYLQLLMDGLSWLTNKRTRGSMSRTSVGSMGQNRGPDNGVSPYQTKRPASKPKPGDKRGRRPVSKRGRNNKGGRRGRTTSRSKSKKGRRARTIKRGKSARGRRGRKPSTRGQKKSSGRGRRATSTRAGRGKKESKRAPSKKPQAGGPGRPPNNPTTPQPQPGTIKQRLRSYRRARR